MLNGAVPAFEITGGLPLAAIRGLFDAALLSQFGTLLFWVWVLPRASTRMSPEEQARLGGHLSVLVRASTAGAVLAGVGWLVFQSGLMAGAAGPGAAFGAVPTVVTSTEFGHLLMLQAAGLCAVGLALDRGTEPMRRAAALAPAAVVLLLQAGHSHAWSMADGPSLLLVSVVVHLLAGGAWLGGLVPLLLVTLVAAPRAAAVAARRFSVLGKWCVGLMAASAACQSWTLVGSIAAVVGTAYGWTACLKLMLFGVLLGFACVNRYRLAPALMGQEPARAKRRLVASIGVQSGFGLAVLIAAGVLSSLPPGMHEQPVWPFSQQISLVTVREDAEFLDEVELALAAIGVAVVLAVVGLWLRRWRRLAALSAAVAIAALAAPHLDLLFVEAAPTSFYRSPTAFSVASIVQGSALYPQRCAACHGVDGRGDGRLASTLPIPPADLTADHLWMHADGDLYWWLTHGIDAASGGLAMPGFASVLTPDDRWGLIDFIRARNAGLAEHATGAWPTPIRAPSFPADCAGGRAAALTDLRGSIVRLVVGDAPAFSERGVVTVRATSDASARPTGALCVADDETTLRAYAIVAGIDQHDLAGTQFLIDDKGWLRKVLQPGASARRDADRLRSAIDDIRRHPFRSVGGMDHMQM